MTVSHNNDGRSERNTGEKSRRLYNTGSNVAPRAMPFFWGGVVAKTSGVGISR